VGKVAENCAFEGCFQRRSHTPFRASLPSLHILRHYAQLARLSCISSIQTCLSCLLNFLPLPRRASLPRRESSQRERRSQRGRGTTAGTRATDRRALCCPGRANPLPPRSRLHVRISFEYHIANISDLLDQSNHSSGLILYLTNILSAATTTSRRRIGQSRQNSIKDGEDLFIFLPREPNFPRNTVSSLSTER
jgi:hypothetical protein